MNEMDSKYLELWRRMNALVGFYSNAGRSIEVEYLVGQFFLLFNRMGELEDNIVVAETELKRETNS